MGLTSGSGLGRALGGAGSRQMTQRNAPQTTVPSATANSAGQDPYATGGWSAVLEYGAPTPGQAPSSAVPWLGTPAPIPGAPGMPGTPEYDYYNNAYPDVRPGPSPAQNQASNAQQFYEQYYGPQQQLLDNQQLNLLARQGLIDANYGQQAGNMRQGNQLDQAQFANQLAGVGIQRGAIPRQIGYYDQLFGNTQQRLGITRQDAWSDADVQNRALQSDATARGAWHAPGTARGLQDIAGELGRQLGLIDTQETDARLNRDEQQAQLRDRDALLQNTAAGLGISGQQLNVALEQGLARLGLDQIMSVGNLMDALAGNDLQAAQLATQIMESAVTNAGLFPTTPMMQPNPNPGVIRPRGAF